MKILSLFSILASLLFTGCVTGPNQIAVVGLEKSGAIKIEDLRPADEGQSKPFSYFISSGAYGIFRVAESRTNPTGVRLLAHRAHEALPDLAASPVIKVHHFVVYANMQSELRRGALVGALGGVFGAAALASQPSPPPKKGEVHTVIIDSAYFRDTAETEHSRGQFTGQENPTNESVHAVYIETEMLGRRIATRSLVPPLTGKPNATMGDIIDICVSRHIAFYQAEVAAEKSKGETQRKEI